MADLATNMSAEWIANAVRKNPCILLDSGNIRTCPVRLSFPNVFTRSKPIPPNVEGKYGANLVFPVQADLTLLKAEAAKATLDKWANAGAKGGPKLRSPFKEQSEMADRYEGYDDQGMFLTCVSDKIIQVFDARMQPVTDPDRIYPGVWAVATIRSFVYDMGVNKGTSFGLQGLMIIADDKRMGGGGASPSDFKGIDIDASVSSEGIFGNDEDDAAAKLFG